MNKSRIALGTVQFGLPYGVANTSGQVNPGEAAAILQQARAAGIDTLDTAIAYGESEQRLGEIGVEAWHVVSKLPAMPERCTNVNTWVQEAVACSLERLKIDSLYGLLLHRSEQLLEPSGEELYSALVDLKEQGMVKKIGVSIYNPEELDLLWPDFRLDLVQAPFNILDRRIQTSGWLTRMHRAGTEVHARSAFLQGLLLMETDRRPEKFNRWKLLWEQWDNWLSRQGLTPVQACLGFVLSQPEIDRVVVGVDNRRQLQEILAATEADLPAPPATLMIEDTDLINPSRWGSL
ncbi:aldo/keto reductase [Methanoculleus taiwanensis]|uniref:Aldo/keto reductase n=1 Tax=Methanoculleus taiwanensis TaxID=1550565 RepID=A0A498GWU8_9EURY|nr:aldo/keto reductase [Methanoculleus taiwanensis]RXE55083.1 aldo/keto reductase [Methanoculleus taiwanensis]